MLRHISDALAISVFARFCCICDLYLYLLF
uniref:Uncharacterized protein n=1 Tax=Anguilla anguilla TaxID=7936 RepID=A0A0E9TFA0_ANGAN